MQSNLMVSQQRKQVLVHVSVHLVCAGLNTFIVYLACSLCYTISVFSLDLWKGKVLGKGRSDMGRHGIMY